MKKFLSLTFICLIIISNACAMEQPLDQAEQPADAHSFLVIQMSNDIVSKLDGKSFLSLARVCKSLNTKCDAVPAKYLGFDFCDAAKLKNKKLIKKFTEQSDWLFEPGMDQEVFVEHHDDTNKIVKIFKHTLNGGVYRYLIGDWSFYYMTQNNKMVRCFVLDAHKVSRKLCEWNMRWVNVATCDEFIHKAFAEYVKKINSRFNYIALKVSAKYIFSGDKGYYFTGYPKKRIYTEDLDYTFDKVSDGNELTNKDILGILLIQATLKKGDEVTRASL